MVHTGHMRYTPVRKKVKLPVLQRFCEISQQSAVRYSATNSIDIAGAQVGVTWRIWHFSSGATKVHVRRCLIVV